MITGFLRHLGFRLCFLRHLGLRVWVGLQSVKMAVTGQGGQSERGNQKVCLGQSSQSQLVGEEEACQKKSEDKV